MNHDDTNTSNTLPDNSDLKEFNPPDPRDVNSDHDLNNESPDMPNEDNYGDNNGSEGSMGPDNM